MEVVGASAAHDEKLGWCLGSRPNMVRRQGRRGPGDLLVPSAPSRAQAELEAAVLSAVTRTMAGMRRRARALRPTLLVRRVRVDGGPLALEVPAAAVGDLLAEVLPAVVGDQLIGIAGVRPAPGREHLDLRVLDGRAAVRLLGVTRSRWREVAGQLAGNGEPVWRDARHERHDRERAEPDDRLPVPVLSGVLRRLPLLSGAAWLTTVVRPDSAELYWRGGPRGEVIAAILADSCCRIPDTSAVGYALPDNGVRGVRLSAVEVGGTGWRGEPEWAWGEWLAVTVPGPALLESAARADAAVPSGVLPSCGSRT